jgi:hypothetical protein
MPKEERFELEEESWDSGWSAEEDLGIWGRDWEDADADERGMVSRRS